MNYSFVSTLSAAEEVARFLLSSVPYGLPLFKDGDLRSSFLLTGIRSERKLP